MRIILFSVLAFFASIHFSFGQCDGCREVENFSPDYCYTDSTFTDYCAQFKTNSGNFLLSKNKKSKILPLAENDTLGYYVSLAETKQYKIKAIELLFIQRAIKTWNKEKRDIGMKFTESGLGYKILREGEGESPQKNQKVTVHYTGTLEDGQKFDSSLDRGQPFTFTLGVGQVIKGWDEGIALLKKGNKALLKIPSNLGYGPRGAGGVIPPNAILYFEVELIDFE